MLDLNTLPIGTHKLFKVYHLSIGLKKRQRSLKSHSTLIGYFKEKSSEMLEQSKKIELEQFKRVEKSSYKILKVEIEIRDEMLLEKYGSDEIFSAEIIAIQ